jgi:hypothetical protein
MRLILFTGSWKYWTVFISNSNRSYSTRNRHRDWLNWIWICSCFNEEMKRVNNFMPILFGCFHSLFILNWFLELFIFFLLSRLKCFGFLPGICFLKLKMLFYELSTILSA